MTTRAAKTIDPITAAVISGALDAIATEMGHKLARMSYSSIIRESEDFGCVLCDREGRQLCESSQSTPLQSGPIPGYIRGINRRFDEIGLTWNAGDIVMHNDAYYGASHGPDVAFCIPVFYGKELVGFAVTTAHHLDLGALSPGTVGIVDATDTYAEGLRFNALKIHEEGRVNQELWRILADNIRIPRLVLGDMQAQIAAARLGEQRLIDLIGQHGSEIFRAASEQLMDYSEAALRREIELLPDGRYEAEGWLDGYVGHPDPKNRDWVIRVALTVAGSNIHVDLTGTSPQVDKPFNMPFEGTVDVAVWLTIRSVLLDSSLHDPVPTNSGLFRPITITAPKGCLANPIFPAPVIGRAVAGNLLADTVMRALSTVMPERVSAGTGNLKAIAFSGKRADGAPWVYIEIIEGSYGGRFGKDGLDAVDTLYANTRNNPIEDVESHYPLRVTRYELREGSAGDGQWRGGLGSIRDVEFLSRGGYSIEGDGSLHPPPGLFGGEVGTPGAVVLNAGSDHEAHLPTKLAFRQATPGDSIRLIGPSGGGYGPPARRASAARHQDSLNDLTGAD